MKSCHSCAYYRAHQQVQVARGGRRPCTCAPHVDFWRQKKSWIKVKGYKDVATQSNTILSSDSYRRVSNMSTQLDNWVSAFCCVVLLSWLQSSSGQQSSSSVTPILHPFSFSWWPVLCLIPTLIGSWFGRVTFLLRGQFYLRRAHLHTHDYGRVWIAAERRLVLTWGMGHRGELITDGP